MTKIVCAVLCSAALLLPAAAGATRPTFQRTTTTAAAAAFDALDGTGCVRTQLNVDTARSRYRVPGGGETSSLFIWLVKYDECTNSYVFSGVAQRTLADSELAVTNDSVSLRADIVVPDDFGGAAVTLDLDLVWTSTRDLLYSERSHGHWRDATLAVFGGSQEVRAAELSGTISDGASSYREPTTAVIGEFRDASLVHASPRTASLAGSFASASTAAPASPSMGERTRSRFRYEAEYAVGIWERWDDSGCVRSLVVVIAESRTGTTEPPDAAPDLYADLSRWDHCTNTPLVWIQTAYPRPRLSSDAFAVERNMSAARIDGRVEAVDLVTGQPVTLTVDLAFDGVGPIARGQSSGKSSVPPDSLVAHGRDQQVSRGAVASGSITDGTHEYLAGYVVRPEDAIGGGFGRVRAASLVKQG